MIDKQLSLVDIFLYFIPGFVISFSLYSLLKLFNINFLSKLNISDNYTLTFAIIFSVIVGFLQSNISMRMFRSVQRLRYKYSFYNKIFGIQNIDYLKLNENPIDNVIKHKICLNYREVFKVDDSDSKIFNSKEAFFLMVRYVDSFNNNSFNQYARRSLMLSNFSASLFFPVTIFSTFLVLNIDIKGYLIINIILLFLILFFVFGYLLTHYESYRKQWAKNYFRLFYIISNNNLDKKKEAKTK